MAGGGGGRRAMRSPTRGRYRGEWPATLIAPWRLTLLLMLLRARNTQSNLSLQRL